jgi:carboxypeptidase Q
MSANHWFMPFHELKRRISFMFVKLLSNLFLAKELFKLKPNKMRKFLLFTALLIGTISVMAQDEKTDLEIINKIIKEGTTNSQIMDIAFHLTDVSGPRLTNSPGYFRAANYAVTQLKKWGADKAGLEAWGDFGQGWQLKKSYIAMTAPYYKPIMAYPKTWTQSTKGLVKADVVVINIKDSTELAQYKGKLAGKVVLVNRADEYKHSFKPDATRYTEAELKTMADFKPNPQPQGQRPGGNPQMARFGAAQRLNTLIKQLITDEGAVAYLTSSPASHDGTIFVQGPAGNRVDFTNGKPSILEIAVAFEDIKTINRLVNTGITVSLDLDVQSEFTGNDVKGYNVIGEIKGTDPKLKDEVVMLGAHLDSWQGSTGATDNASGCAVMLEVMRIFKTLNLQPKRTIRIALWSGEEQGLLGSRGWIKNNVGDRVTKEVKPEQEKISAYYNIDNGTGKIRGVYLEGNSAVQPIFAKWLEPFKEAGASTLTLQNTGGTDHISFNELGIPGFQFIQDEIEYDTRTHHTTMDSYDHLVPDDLKQMATIVATFVYNTAQRAEKLPRKEMPKPVPAR